MNYTYPENKLIVDPSRTIKAYENALSVIERFKESRKDLFDAIKNQETEFSKCYSFFNKFPVARSKVKLGERYMHIVSYSNAFATIFINKKTTDYGYAHWEFNDENISVNFYHCGSYYEVLEEYARAEHELSSVKQASEKFSVSYSEASFITKCEELTEEKLSKEFEKIIKKNEELLALNERQIKLAEQKLNEQDSPNVTMEHNITPLEEVVSVDVVDKQEDYCNNSFRSILKRLKELFK